MGFLEEIMATLEKVLDKAFEVTWQHSIAVEGAHANSDDSDSQEHDPMLLSAEASFIGALDVLGSVLQLAGRIPAYELSTGDSDRWHADSSRVLALMMEWAHGSGRIDDAEYAGYRAVYGPEVRAVSGPS